MSEAVTGLVLLAILAGLIWLDKWWALREHGRGEHDTTPDRGCPACTGHVRDPRRKT